MRSKLKKGIIIFWKWLVYIFKDENHFDAINDFIVWTETTIIKKELIQQDTLWITFPAIRWLNNWLTPTMKVFEWGSGSSTLFLAKRVCEVYSVEHDNVWYSNVTTKCAQLQNNNVHIFYVPPDNENCVEGTSNFKSIYKTTDLLLKDKSFFKYATSIKELSNDKFDLIIVDGRARVGCLFNAKERIKNGGVIILDNSERPEYEIGLQMFSGPEWKVIHFNGPSPASIWPVFGRTTIIFLREEGG